MQSTVLLRACVCVCECFAPDNLAMPPDNFVTAEADSVREGCWFIHRYTDTHMLYTVYPLYVLLCMNRHQ